MLPFQPEAISLVYGQLVHFIPATMSSYNTAQMKPAEVPQWERETVQQLSCIPQQTSSIATKTQNTTLYCVVL